MAEQRQRWPDVIWIVRHGESAGNVAAAAAHEASLPTIQIATRDVDVPLSARGEEQATALGHWFASLPEDERPTVVLTSPYVRAQRTAEIICRHGGTDEPDEALIIDERLREREFGILDRLTALGVQQRFPEQFEQRRQLGKFYHRPPGGESWADVILRLRSMLDTINLHYNRERVLIVCHEVVVLCLRYLLECMTEAEVLEIDAAHAVPNCGVTSYEFNPQLGRWGKMELKLFNFVAPLVEGGAAVTAARDVPVAAK
ncbi:MAG TPA: histidine phosphatase family protein [Longimicrobium sp.]|nr:histidine phosphatase family protein [Longimicrobium sp.]